MARKIKRLYYAKFFINWHQYGKRPNGSRVIPASYDSRYKRM